VNKYFTKKGPFFLVACIHRATGIGLVFILALQFVVQFEAPYHGIAVVSFLAWMASIPLIFHALNGARLILYESYGRRDDEQMLIWVLALSCLYLLVLTIIALSRDQAVSPFFFWLTALSLSLIAACAIRVRLQGLGHSLPWVLQRVTAALLLVLAPSLTIYIHLHPLEGAQRGFQLAFLRGVHILLLLSTLYHAGYGLWSIAADYLGSGIWRAISALAVFLGMLALGSVGMRLILSG